MSRTRRVWSWAGTLGLTAAVALGAAGCVLVPFESDYGGGAAYGPGPVVVAPAPPVVFGGFYGWEHRGGRVVVHHGDVGRHAGARVVHHRG